VSESRVHNIAFFAFFDLAKFRARSSLGVTNGMLGRTLPRPNGRSLGSSEAWGGEGREFYARRLLDEAWARPLIRALAYLLGR